MRWPVSLEEGISLYGNWCISEIHQQSAHMHVICTSSAHHLEWSLWSLCTPIVFPVPKKLVIDVPVVYDVVWYVDTLNGYCPQVICVVHHVFCIDRSSGYSHSCRLLTEVVRRLFLYCLMWFILR